MAWEQRQRGGKYYYQKRKAGGKVISRYIGSGETATLIAETEAAERNQKAQKQKEVRLFCEEWEDLDHRNAEYFVAVEAMFRQALEATGYYRHHRGEWRKRLMSNFPAVVGAEQLREFSAESDRLIEQANSGNQEACDTLWKRVDDLGMSSAFAESFTDTGQKLREQQHKDLIVREAFKRKMRSMQEELGWQKGSPVEKLLIERIVICWVHLHLAEVRKAQVEKNGMRERATEFADKAVDRAQRRYLSAIQSLTIVRRLQIPAMQVNIGDKQINVVQG